MNQIDIWKALAEPARRSLLELMQGGAQPVGVLAHTSGLSQSLVSQHLRILLQANLVSVTRDGKCRLYSLNREGFLTVAEWLMFYENFWEKRIDRLAHVVNENE